MMASISLNPKLTDPNQSFTCPNCSSGFVEEVENEQPEQGNDVFNVL